MFSTIESIVIKVNHHNVEQDEHEAVVELVKESGDMVTLNVQSIKQEQAGAGTREMTVEIKKENNTFGFSINQDAQGFFIQMLAPEGPAENAGVSVGDRVIGIDDREDFECKILFVCCALTILLYRHGL